MTTRLMSGISGMPGLCIFIPEYLQKDVKILSQSSAGSDARGKNRIKKNRLKQCECLSRKKIPGAVLLSHSQIYSTIAAGALNYRVREGNVCFCSAMDAGK